MGDAAATQNKRWNRLRLFACLIVLAAFAAPSVGLAQGAYTAELVAQRVSASSSVSSLDEDLFGE